MKMTKKNFKGKTKINLLLMDESIRNESNKELCDAFYGMIDGIRKGNGSEYHALQSGNAYVVDLCGTLFWVSCRPDGSEEVNTFVSSRRARY